MLGQFIGSDLVLQISTRAAKMVGLAKKKMIMIKRVTRVKPSHELITLQPLDKHTTLQPLDKHTTLQPLDEHTTLQPLDEHTTLQPPDEHTTLQPLNEHTTLQPLDEHTTLQPLDEHTTLQPLDEHTTLQPPDEHTTLQPLNEHTTLQPLDEHTTLQPLDEHTTLQPPDEHTTLQPLNEHTTLQPLDEHTTLQPLDEHTTLQPLDEHTTLQPLDEHTTLQPPDEHTTLQPLNEHTTLQPLDEHTTLQPLDEHTTLQPLDEHTTLQPPDEHTTLQPLNEHTTLQPLDEHTTLQPLDEHTTLQPLDEHTTLLPLDEHTTLQPLDEHTTLQLLDEHTTLQPLDEHTTLQPLDEHTTLLPLDEHTTLQPLDEHTTLQLLDEHTTLQPLDEHTTLQPLDEHTTLQPLDEHTTLQPLDEHTTLQPLDEHTTLQPLDEHTTLQLLDEHTTLQPLDEHTTLQPLDEHTTLQPLDEHTTLQPLDEHTTLQPLDKHTTLQPPNEHTTLQPLDEHTTLQPLDKHTTLQPPNEHTTLQPPNEHTTLQPLDEHTTLQPLDKHTTLQPPNEHTTLQPPNEHIILQPLDEHTTLQPLDKHTTLQPPNEHTTLQPLDEHTTLQPLDKHTTLQPPNEHTTLQPPNEHTTLQPLDEHTTLQPLDKHTTLQPPNEHTTLQPPNEHTTLQPLDEHTTLQPLDKHTTLQPPNEHTTLQPPNEHIILQPLDEHTTLQPLDKHTTLQPPNEHIILQPRLTEDPSYFEEDVGRFSLLLLDPGEFYFDDLSVVLIVQGRNNDDERRPGRLKLCSKSLVFEPKNLTLPLVKIPLKDCTSLSKYEPPLICKISGNTLDITCTAYIEMLCGNILAPYVFETKTQRFLFVLNYAQVDVCLVSIKQLHRASSLPAAEQNQMIATIATARQSKVSFNPSWLEDLYEKVILESFGNKITPLVVNPGRIVLSSTNLYFQPFNNIEPHKLLKVRLAGIKRIIKRRFLLQQVGIEIYFKDREPIKYLYLTLKTQGARDTLYKALLELPELQLNHSDQEIMTLRWQNGVLSNYDYLIYLNSLADRSLNDLTQYPVFPWVISNYTCDSLDLSNANNYRDLSKPIGALNPTRLERLKERYNEMPEPKFLYGSHYSTPGFVLFYLVRKFPQYMLCLQNGRFDHPDRMFNSIPDIWRNVLTNMSDFKELVPEFYDIEQKGDFLENNYGINFGYRHDGTKVGCVQLPPWAETPEEFVNKLREALESDIVSRQLHLWIDLIFGYKQRGLEAEKSNNLFYYLCYEGSVNLDMVRDWNQRHALEVQIMEFGQIPKQIFHFPHPARMLTSESSLLKHSSVLASVSDNWCTKTVLEPVHFCNSHKESITSVAICHQGVSVASVGRDTLLKIHSLKTGQQERSAVLSTMTLSSLCILPDNATIIVGCWDSCVVIYDVECGRIVTELAGHEDAISCVAWDQKRKRLISGSWDCSVRVWNSGSSWSHMKPTNSLVSQLDMENRIKCMVMSKDNNQLAVGTEAGELIIWSLEDHFMTQQLSGEVNASVNDVAFSEDGCRVLSCGNNSMLNVYDLTTGMQVCNKVFEEKLLCLALVGADKVILGGALGMVYLFDLVRVQLLKQVRAHRDAVLCVDVSYKGDVIVTGGEDHQLIVWEIS